MSTENFTRLPKTVIPIHYDITLKPDLEKSLFEGTELIKLEITVESPVILLNSCDLNISEVECEYGDGGVSNKLTQKAKAFELKDEVLKITFDPPLVKGNGILKIGFSGILNDQLKGFYRSKYKGPNGEDRYNAVTQFAPTDARRCFPCWDEPAVKSTFGVTLIVPKDGIALSNMPIKHTASYEAQPSLQIVQFDTTPIMSTYLLAICVGEFDYLEDKTSEGVLCRVYTSIGKKEQGRFALNIATKVLPFYNEYFGIAYPLPKLDLIAVADFAYGAMENWGLITYRETCLLVDELESSATNRQRVALTVGHEIAHQWFGNLVTMEWWTHLWLNEGYASFVEFLCVDHLFPEYDIWTQFITDTHNWALDLDCLNSSHPIEIPVTHPSEIVEIFDAISYCKGASVIRMLHNFIGDKDFRKGMNTYLTRHQYGNAFTEDLWTALEEASLKPVKAVMTSWTKQMGFPVIKVNGYTQENNSRSLTLAQEKFWANPAAKGDLDTEYFWNIPLSFCCEAAPTKIIHEELMQNKTVKITINGVNSTEWIKVNPGIRGFYRVQYSADVLNQFIPAISSKAMGPLDRLALLDDLFALVQAGQSSTVEVLNLLQAFVDEDNYTVWANISNIMGKLSLLLDYSDNMNAFKAFGRKLFSVIYEETGWEAKQNENHLQTMLRSMVLNKLVGFEDQKILEEAKKRFMLHISGEKPIVADLRVAVYKSVLASGDEDAFKTMLKLYREVDNQEEKERISRSFVAIQDVKILTQLFEFAISDEVRSQDTVTFFIAGGNGSKAGRELAWNFFKDYCQVFKERYPTGFMVGRLVKHLTENFASEEKALEVEEFFKNHTFSSTERSVQQAVESIRLNEAWLKRDLSSIQKYLDSKV